MTVRGRKAKRIAAGAAFFALFFQFFLPVALAAAADVGAPNRVLEICSIDGVRLVDFDLAEDASGEAVQAAELCTLCLTHTAWMPAKSIGAERSAFGRSADADANPTPYHARAFISSDLAARGPPLG